MSYRHTLVAAAVAAGLSLGVPAAVAADATETITTCDTMTVTVTVDRRVSRGDGIIAVVLALIFAGGLVEALGYSFNAGLVPRIVCIAGLVFSVAFLARWLLSLLLGRAQTAVVTEVPGGESGDEDGTAEDYVFGTASWRTWTVALLWFAGFFVGLWLLGAILMVPLFAVSYLIVVGRVHPVWAAVYAAATWVVMSIGFDQLLEVSLPKGLW